VDNPNAFDVALDRLRYDFKVNDKRWLSGSSEGLGNVSQKQQNLIALPISLNFTEIGHGLYTLLKGGHDLEYSLSGTLDATSGHELINRFDMPFSNTGLIKLSP
jgi:hypothetical protein